MKRLWRHPLRLLNYALSAAALGYVLWQLHLPTLGRQLGGMVWWLVVVAIVLDVLSIALQAVRWRFLLRPAHPPFGTVLQATYIGTLFNETLPLRTGDVARGLIVARRTGRGLANVLSTEVVERVSDGLALAALVWVATRHLHMPHVLRLAEILLDVVVITVVLVGVLLALRGESFHDWITRWQPRGRIRHRVQQVGVDLLVGLRVLRDARAVVVAGIVAVGINVLQVFIMWMMLRAYHIDLSILHAATVLAIISIGIFIPNTPGNVGPWQFFCVLALSLFGVDQSTAAGFSLVAFVLLTLPLVGGGAIALVTSPFTARELRRFPTASEPFGGALELVAEEAGVVFEPHGLDTGERAVVDALFRVHGYNCTSYLASEADLSTFLAPADAGFLSFMLVADVAIVLGEPVSSPGAMADVAHSFEAVMAVQGVDQLLYYGVTSRAAPVLKSAGYQLMPLGPEAIFPLAEFSLGGGPMKSVRHKVNVLVKAGAVVAEVLMRDGRASYGQVSRPELPLPDANEAVRQMVETSAQWEAARDVSSVGFTVSSPRLDRPGARRYFALFLRERLEGFFVYEPIPARNGWYMDCERRRPGAPQGVTEVLTAETHRMLAGEGAAMVSWGTTALARPEDGSKADPFRDEHRLLDQAFSVAYQTLGGIFPYKGLHENKAKYHPVWEETYLAFRPRFGPRMAYAIVKAHHPEGVSDLLLSRLRAGRQEPTSAPPPSVVS